MTDPAYALSASNRVAVLAAIKGVCAYRKWTLFAAHVRTNHVHVVVEAGVPPEKAMNQFKAYASRQLNRAGDRATKRWARRGSTRWLWSDEEVRRAVQYVVEEQGEPMALFVAPDLTEPRSQGSGFGALPGTRRNRF